jgi:hypothetical protein
MISLRAAEWQSHSKVEKERRIFHELTAMWNGSYSTRNAFDFK